MLVLFKSSCFDGYEYKFNFWGELYIIKLDFSQKYGWLIFLFWVDRVKFEIFSKAYAIHFIILGEDFGWRYCRF